jgi:hypothetical protein
VLGGVLVITCETFTSRNIALRSVWFADAAIHLTLFLYIRNRLTTERIEAARAAAVQTAAG